MSPFYCIERDNKFSNSIKSAENATLIIYSKETDKPIASGLLLNKAGIFITAKSAFI
jgi:hypothetical protein